MMRLSQTYVHANGDDVRTWRKSSNPKPMIAIAAHITLGERNLTVHRIPWRVRVGRCCRKSRAIGRALVVKILVAELNLSDCARRIRPAPGLRPRGLISLSPDAVR